MGKKPKVCARNCRIGELAKSLEVQPHVIRYWETEFGVASDRSKSGQRVYTPQQASRLRMIRWLLHVELYTIAGAKRQLRLHECWVCNG